MPDSPPACPRIRRPRRFDEVGESAAYAMAVHEGVHLGQMEDKWRAFARPSVSGAPTSEVEIPRLASGHPASSLEASPHGQRGGMLVREDV